MQTKQMIPRVKSDRQKAFDELSDLIDLLEEDEMIKQSEMFAKELDGMHVGDRGVCESKSRSSIAQLVRACGC